MGKLVRIIEILVAFGIDINARNRIGNAPLHFVRQVKTAKAFVENGAKLDVHNSLNLTPAEDVKTHSEKGYEYEEACMVNEWFTLLMEKKEDLWRCDFNPRYFRLIPKNDKAPHHIYTTYPNTSKN